MTTDEIMKKADTYACRPTLEYRAALLKAVVEMEMDAARYRWLRVCENDNTVIYGDTSHAELMMEEALDAAIDAAMRKETP